MESMHELITVEAFGRGLRALCAAWFVLGLAMVLMAAVRRHTRGLRLWLAAALLGPLVWALWCFYCWMVRVDPQTGYVGLHQVRVFALNLVVFIAVGMVLGLILGRLARDVVTRGPSEGDSGVPPAA